MKKIISIILIFNLLSCKAQKDIKFSEESTSLMLHIFKKFDDNKSTKNYGLQNSDISNNILNKVSIDEFASFEELILNSHKILPLAINYNISETKKRVDYLEIFKVSELKYMKKQLENIQSKTWMEYLKINPSNKKSKNKLIKQDYFYSVPVFTKNKKNSLIYMENSSGGVLIIYQKIKNKWQAVASASVWIS